MPFHGLPETFAPAPAETAPDFTRPSLEGLAHVLENPPAWPEGWAWDFTRIGGLPDCGTAGCAVGIARTMWLPHAAVGEIYDALGIDHSDAQPVFCRGEKDPRITAPVVAARIRDHLAGRAIRYLVAGDRDREAR